MIPYDLTIINEDHEFKKIWNATHFTRQAILKKALQYSETDFIAVLLLYMIQDFQNLATPLKYVFIYERYFAEYVSRMNKSKAAKRVVLSKREVSDSSKTTGIKEFLDRGNFSINFTFPFLFLEELERIYEEASIILSLNQDYQHSEKRIFLPPRLLQNYCFDDAVYFMCKNVPLEALKIEDELKIKHTPQAWLECGYAYLLGTVKDNKSIRALDDQVKRSAPSYNKYIDEKNLHKLKKDLTNYGFTSATSGLNFT